MKIKEWLQSVSENNFSSSDRAIELGWKSWDCSITLIDGYNKRIYNLLSKLQDDIKNRYDIKLQNNLQKENYGGTFTTFILYNDNVEYQVSMHDFTEMYRYNVYNDNKNIFSCEETEEIIEWLNSHI